MDEEKTLDFFLSYKSEDAVIVRMVAEQMRATGASVWFAEYDVGLANREHFMEEIETGIARCRFGICFTNNEFATSSYCRKELELLLKHIGPRRIIEVALPREDLPHHTFPQMKEAMSIEIPIAASRKCDGASQTLPCTTVHEILEFVQESTGVPLSRPLCSESAHTDKRYYRYAGDHYSLDLGGWAVKRPIPDEEAERTMEAVAASEGAESVTSPPSHEEMEEIERQMQAETTEEQTEE